MFGGSADVQNNRLTKHQQRGSGTAREPSCRRGRRLAATTNKDFRTVTLPEGQISLTGFGDRKYYVTSVTHLSSVPSSYYNNNNAVLSSYRTRV